MIGIIIATHGYLSRALVDAAQMFLGSIDQIETISFLAGDSLESLQTQMLRAIDGLNDCAGIIVLTDLQGGSPCNMGTVLQKTKENIITIYGVNLPMIIQIVEDRSLDLGLAEVCENAINAGREAIGIIQI